MHAAAEHPTTEDTALELLGLRGYLADADEPGEVQLRESAAGETGRWIVLRREDIVEQSSGEEADLPPGESIVRVSPDAELVFRATIPASRALAAEEATRPEPRAGIDGGRIPDPGFEEPDRWPRVPPPPPRGPR